MTQEEQVAVEAAAAEIVLEDKSAEEAVKEVPELEEEEKVVDEAQAEKSHGELVAGVDLSLHSLLKSDAASEGRLIEVSAAMIEANDVFNRVKSEKIAEQALCSIRNDQAQYEGLAKEIVGKAIKQKERERANRASAAASRAKVLRYQTELESRLNRMEAERNAYRKDLIALRSSGESSKRNQADANKQFAKLQKWIRQMETANPQFVRSIIAQGEMDVVFGEGPEGEEDDGKSGDSAAKRRRV